MEKVNDVMDMLNRGELFTSNGQDIFVMRKDKISCYRNGSKFVMSIDDFLDLYSQTNFYVYKEEVLVDEEKDEAYYRYYKK